VTSSGIERPSWDKTWFNVANVVAKRSLCVRDKVGAVIVDSMNRIVATGYNGPPTGFEHDDRPCTEWCSRAQAAVEVARLGRPLMPHHLDAMYDDCPSLHAEANAISVCDRLARLGGTIYVTSHTCMNCAKLIANSGLMTVQVQVGIAAKHRNPEAVYNFLETCGIEVIVEMMMT
jgi:deoxycytidylate deaminase